MQRLTLILAAAAGALALVPTASALVARALAATAAAKEVKSASLCGPGSCAKLDKSKAVLFLKELHGEGEAVSSGAPLESWYSLRLGLGEARAGEEVYIYAYYLPQAGLLRLRNDPRSIEPWLRPSAAELEALRAAQRSVKPFPKPQPIVTVAGRRVSSGSPYVALLGPLTPRPLPAQTGKSTMIRLAWRASSPWSAETALTYFARVNLVCRTDGCFGVPASMAADVERGLPAVRRR